MKLTIHCVDDETTLTREGSKSDLLAFLRKHDHEGSALQLEEITNNPDEVYRKLGDGG